MCNPSLSLRSMRLEREQRHAVATGVRDPLHLDPNDGAGGVLGPRYRGKVEPAVQFVVIVRPWEQHLATTMQPNDPRRLLEGAQHHADPAVLTQMRQRLSAASDLVQDPVDSPGMAACPLRALRSWEPLR
jgi:hypothetical protein